MLHLDDEAAQQGEVLAKLARDFLGTAYVSDKIFCARLSTMQITASNQLSRIWLSYETARSFDPIRLEARVTMARDARGKLCNALRLLKDVPRQTLADYRRFIGDEERPAFDDIVDELEAIWRFARQFDRELKPGTTIDEATTHAVHSLARLFSQIRGKKFPKTLHKASETEFGSIAPEFVRRILQAIDPSITIGAVAGALKSYSSRET
ncbi:hypothetical protein [Rhizobium leguminosarum]|jgi:hypothetical protein|uniref:hypothetical protein n=1 Tax=Rhizobium leguminosarum TaxID=384 RepID=UPI0010326174|nr:hypothetical protein [Rhizobium leguminosarum]TAX37040.1 hypothetical protein ELI06_23200 [Rhizobium leguminosarum]